MARSRAQSQARTGLDVVTPAAVEPLTTAEAKSHLIVEHTGDDALIDAMIEAARKLAETRTNRQLIETTYDLTLAGFSDVILLPRPPLVSVTSIAYTDTDGNSQVLDTAVYDVNTGAVPGEIRLAYNQSWPSVRDEYNAVVVRYVAGYADGDAVPEAIKRWMCLQIGDMYSHREKTVVGSGSAVNTFVDALIEAYAVPDLP